MVKLAITDSPSAQVVAKAAAAVTVTDATGRTLTLKKPGVLAQYRLIEALGDTAKNEVYMRMVLPLIYIAEIDGDPVAPCTRKSEIEALIQRLDEAGIAAVMEGVSENYGQSDPEADRKNLKN